MKTARDFPRESPNTEVAIVMRHGACLDERFTALRAVARLSTA